MTWAQIGAIGELLGSIGVIFSLLYLAFQIKADKDATLSNTRQLRQNGVRETSLLLADSDNLAPILARIGDAAPQVQDLMNTFGLTREEASRIGFFYIATLRQLETNILMPMTSDETEQTHETIRTFMKGPMGIWWISAKPLFSKPFVVLVDQLMDNRV